MKALVIGYGSIGARHARVLRELGVDTGVVSRRAGIDFTPRYATVREALETRKADMLVIANRTNEHAPTLDEILSLGFRGTILVEKPVFNSLERVKKMRRRGGVYVAYNLRFHPLVLKLKENLKGEKVFSAHLYVGKYLPDWRPGDYRKSYSASAREGGGVLRDLSHELDLANWLFGGWRRLTALGGRISHLQIKSDDVFSVLMEARKCPIISVQMNYLDRILRRELLVHTSRHTYRVDLAKGEFEQDGKILIRQPFDRDLTYRLEHKALIRRNFKPLCSFSEGLDVMRIIEAAEKASRAKIWVTR